MPDLPANLHRPSYPRTIKACSETDGRTVAVRLSQGQDKLLEDGIANVRRLGWRCPMATSPLVKKWRNLSL